eukprot:scaffold3740_cov322-Prasinococcus_capsulatus_cf.AAC.13
MEACPRPRSGQGTRPCFELVCARTPWRLSGSGPCTGGRCAALRCAALRCTALRGCTNQRGGGGGGGNVAAAAGRSPTLIRGHHSRVLPHVQPDRGGHDQAVDNP